MESKVAWAEEEDSSESKTRISEDEALLHRAVSTVYTAIVKELGVLEAAYGAEFLGAEAEEEHRLEWTGMFKDYEAFLENRLEAFCAEEGLASASELTERVAAAAAQSERASKMVDLLCAGASYNKFVSVMRRRASKLHKRK